MYATYSIQLKKFDILTSGQEVYILVNRSYMGAFPTPLPTLSPP